MWETQKANGENSPKEWPIRALHWYLQWEIGLHQYPIGQSQVLACKKGGIVITRHNKIRGELFDVATKAFPPYFVHNKPKINACRAIEPENTPDSDDYNLERTTEKNVETFSSAAYGPMGPTVF
jgi:hypothetical protein